MTDESASSTLDRPLLAVTIGDPAGIGPEVVAKAVASPDVQAACRPLIIGDPAAIDAACRLAGIDAELSEIPSASHYDNASDAWQIWNPSQVSADSVLRGQVSAAGGQAAFDYLTGAIDAALAGTVDGIVTAPLSKSALHAAGHNYPGHTEILGERCGVREFAMMLYLPGSNSQGSATGFGVAHATLHTSIRSVPDLLNTPLILAKIRLVDEFLRRLGRDCPHIGVCALNPHAGEDGLFGDEESRIIQPAVDQAAASGIDVVGPIPADALMRRAIHGEFDGAVAMYHDQGHIAVKLAAFDAAVNVTLGLPIIRTSPSHGTAFDIAWKNQASSAGMREAILAAARLATSRKQN